MIHVSAMSKMIQIRHVLDYVHRKLKSRAALEGVSLSDYLLVEQAIGRAADSGRAMRATGKQNTGAAERVSGASRSGGTQARADFMMFRLFRYSHRFLLPRIWELRHNFIAYDAAYI